VKKAIKPRLTGVGEEAEPGVLFPRKGGGKKNKKIKNGGRDRETQIKEDAEKPPRKEGVPDRIRYGACNQTRGAKPSTIEELPGSAKTNSQSFEDN